MSDAIGLFRALKYLESRAFNAELVCLPSYHFICQATQN